MNHTPAPWLYDHRDNQALIGQPQQENTINKHTPSPWVVGQPNKGPVAGTVPVHTADYMESYRSGQLICSVYGTAAFSDANARLIAAAPDLLAALKAMHACHRAFSNAENWTALDDDARAAAESAINKATGE